MSVNDIDELILASIEKGLGVLGETPRNAIWAILEQDYNIDIHKKTLDVKKITEILQKIFGLGYRFLDALFKQNLEQSVGKEFDADCFLKAVEILKGEKN